MGDFCFCITFLILFLMDTYKDREKGEGRDNERKEGKRMNGCFCYGYYVYPAMVPLTLLYLILAYIVHNVVLLVRVTRIGEKLGSCFVLHIESFGTRQKRP